MVESKLGFTTSRAACLVVLAFGAACSSSETTSPAGAQDSGAQDAGTQVDASTAADGGAPSVDAGVASEAGDAAVCAATFADCTTFVDLTAATADRTITFENYAYAPKCARIKAGQSVTFRGDFVSHPLEQACGPNDVLTGSKGTPVTLALPGTYGYFCLDHGSSLGQAMSGVLRVEP